MVIFPKHRKQHLSGRDAVIAAATSQPGCIHLRAWGKEDSCGFSHCSLVHFLNNHSQGKGDEVGKWNEEGFASSWWQKYN